MQRGIADASARPRWSLRRTAATVLTAGLTSLVLGGCGLFPGAHTGTPAAARRPPIGNPAASVVKLIDRVPACNKQFEGTGWVFAPGYVATNAHVVAGATQGSLTVHTAGGASYSGDVVEFNPVTDVAVVHVSGLPLAPLRFGGNPADGTSAVFTGYPGDGPEVTKPAAITAVEQARVPDIYGTDLWTRQIEVLTSDVQPGASGSPLLKDGAVVGMVYAKDATDGTTGYAIAPDQIRSDLNAGNGRTQPIAATWNGNTCVE